MATIYEVAELSGFSLTTVSRVINNDSKVSAKTKATVLDAMKSLGYRPNAMAQSLASSRSNIIGVLVSEVRGLFFGNLMEGVEKRFRAVNKHVIISAGHSDESREKDGIEFLLGRQCDALILLVEAVSDDYLRELAKGPVPIVLINRVVEGLEENCIYLDNKMGGYLATKSVLGKGHKSIAYISGHSYKQDSNDRLAGHKAALAEAGIEFDEELFYVGNFQQESGRCGLTELLHSGKPFSALICANDDMAAGAMATARKLGISLPTDLSIVGFDNVSYAHYLYPTLTTVHYPISEMAITAAELILKTVYNYSELNIKYRFLPELVERNSVYDMTPD